MAARAQRIEQDDVSPVVDVSDLIKRVEDNPALVLTDEQAFEAYYTHVEQQALGVKADLSTAAGRDRIRSAASEIARKKTTFDKTRKELTEDYRRKTATINAVGKLVVDRFAALQVRVRQPLTDWEEAEDARKAEADRLLEYFRSAAIVRADETAADVEARLDEVRAVNINDEILGPRTEMATDLRDDAVKALRETLDRIKQAEADRAELERLRRAEAERQEREAREQREREAKETEEARQKAEQDRIERERQEAADRARREAEEASERARQEVENKRSYARQIIEHIKQVGLGTIGGQTYPYPILIRELEDKIVIDDALGDMQEEVRAVRDATLATVKLAQERAIERAVEQEREAAARAEAEEKARREADQAHRSAILGAIKLAIMACGVEEPKAKEITLALAAGNVPHTVVKF